MSLINNINNIIILMVFLLSSISALGLNYTIVLPINLEQSNFLTSKLLALVANLLGIIVFFTISINRSIFSCFLNQ